MQATPKNDAPETDGDGSIKLRLNVYDALTAGRGATTPTKQAQLHGIDRTHLHRIRSGLRNPSLSLAMRMANDLGTTVEVLFERDGVSA